MKLLIDGHTLSTPEINRGIGQVFKNLVHHIVMLRPNLSTYITVQDQTQLEVFSPWVAETLQPVLTTLPDTSLPQNVRNAEYLAQTQAILNKHEIDAYLNPNPLMLNSYLPIGLKKCITASTLFDIIPLQLKHKLLDHWPEELRREYNRRLEGLEQQTDLLFGISQDACRQFQLHHFNINSKIIPAVISYQEELFWPLPRKPIGKANPHILMVGGDDPRKNMVGAIEALSYYNRKPDITPLELRIACHLSSETRTQLEQYAKTIGVDEHIRFLGFVSDIELASLYRRASLSLFPSYLEGFGLPVLESMACGTLPICSDINTAREIGQDLAEYASPFDPKGLADRIEAGLDRVANDKQLTTKLVKHAQTFQWKKTAQTYLDNLQLALPAARSNIAETERPKVAMLTPWPPQQSGIAEYAWQISQHLNKICDLTIVTDADNVPKELGITLLRPEEFTALQDSYDHVIAHMGNSQIYHQWIYEWIIQSHLQPLIVLHDVNIHPFLQHTYLNGEKPKIYYDALSKDVPQDEARKIKSKIAKGEGIDIFSYPMSRHLLSKGFVLVHNRWSLDTLTARPETTPKYGAAAYPLAGNAISVQPRQYSRLAQSKFKIVVPGFVNAPKRPAVCLEAFAKLREFGIDAEITFLGKCNSEIINWNELVSEAGLDSETAKLVQLTGFVTNEAFESILAEADLVWNLRYPSMGESSATLRKSLELGRPTIVSDYAQFKEFPDSVVWKIPVDEDEAFHLTNLSRALLANRDIRRQLSSSAAAWVEGAPTFQDVARNYLVTLRNLAHAE